MKPYGVCHMMPSVDGRLRTERWDVPESGHEEYERTADSYKADAWICGRKTMEGFADGHWKQGRGRGMLWIKYSVRKQQQTIWEEPAR